MIETASSDEGVLIRAAAGDPSAARELLDATGEIVYGFVYARVGGRRDTAEDIVQTTYLEAMRSAGTFRGESAVETWLCAIARRHVARHFESERRRLRLERKLRLVATESEIEDEAPTFAGGEATIGALGRLQPVYRQVLVLKYLDGLSVEEIAGELGRTRVQIQSLLQRARSGLRRELEAEARD
ncbi:MAG: RNA polymerase sigma factor [Actinobacteria bacterium]|nr:RNA polymerase sigma factor [Actinomycetota bacterium]